MSFCQNFNMGVFDGTYLLIYFTDMDAMKLSVLLHHGRMPDVKFINPT